MSLSMIKKALGPRTMTREDLYKLAKDLHSIYKCVNHFEALREKRGYDNGKEFPHDLCKRGVEKDLLDHWYSTSPATLVLGGDGRNYHARPAGCEWAAALRVRCPDAVVLRVYSKDRTTGPEDILFQILSSLIYNLSSLVPRQFEKMPDLCRRNFELLSQGGALGLKAGVKILDALPQLQLGEVGFLCVVDSLDLAEFEETADAVSELTTSLRSLLARNNGHLVYTVAQKSIEMASRLRRLT